jgi:REP element-mobilizing transposase RayT
LTGQLIVCILSALKSTGRRLNDQRDEQRVPLIVYHLVWTPKRRKPALTGAIAAECRRLIEHKCSARGWHIVEH